MLTKNFWRNNIDLKSSTPFPSVTLESVFLLLHQSSFGSSIRHIKHYITYFSIFFLLCFPPPLHPCDCTCSCTTNTTAHPPQDMPRTTNHDNCIQLLLHTGEMHTFLPFFYFSFPFLSLSQTLCIRLLNNNEHVSVSVFISPRFFAVIWKLAPQWHSCQKGNIQIFQLFRRLPQRHFSKLAETEKKYITTWRRPRRKWIM